VWNDALKKKKRVPDLEAGTLYKEISYTTIGYQIPGRTASAEWHILSSTGEELCENG
jgi:hypothetical protein